MVGKLHRRPEGFTGYVSLTPRPVTNIPKVLAKGPFTSSGWAVRVRNP
jgi:hypothetical protein